MTNDANHYTTPVDQKGWGRQVVLPVCCRCFELSSVLDTVNWMTVWASGPWENLCHLSTKILFRPRISTHCCRGGIVDHPTDFRRLMKTWFYSLAFSFTVSAAVFWFLLTSRIAAFLYRAQRTLGLESVLCWLHSLGWFGRVECKGNTDWKVGTSEENGERCPGGYESFGLSGEDEQVWNKWGKKLKEQLADRGLPEK